MQMSQLFKWRRYKAHIALSPEYFHKEQGSWSSQRGSVEMNLTSIAEDTSWAPDLPPWVKVPALLWAVV